MNDFRTLALALPGAVEHDHFGSPSFRVDDKIFAQLSGDEAEALIKVPLHVQAALVVDHPGDCRPEGRWGKHGWTHVRWRSLRPDVIGDLLELSWRAVAPRRARALPPGPCY